MKNGYLPIDKDTISLLVDYGKATVDRADMKLVSLHKWGLSYIGTKQNPLGQAVASTEVEMEDGEKRTLYLSGFLLGLPPGDLPASLNGNLLDCRRSNLSS